MSAKHNKYVVNQNSSILMIYVLSLNNSRFGDFVDRIHPIQLEIKDTIDTDRYASYIDLHLEIDSEGQFIKLKIK
jgi:hypothetical protein